ncbi:MAG: hypothetical protein HS116_25045 [Planctomycetes bacterium]|nr:hypothetical protein [Planctomycetota bacterium]
MFGTDYFQIIHGEGIRVGEKAPSGDWDSLEVGTAMVANGPTTSIPANGRLEGFLLKKVTEDGPSYEDLNLGAPNHPAKKGQAVTMEKLPDGAIIEVEGEPEKAFDDETPGLLVTDGTGAIDDEDTAGTQLSVKNGRWYKAQSGDYVEGLLHEQVDPVADDANVRIQIEIRRMGIKA